MKLVFVYCICVLCAFTILVAQDVPRIISYQGVLVDANGKPITSSQQNPVKIKFEIINSSNQLIKDIGNENPMTVIGGLFTRPLDLSGIPQNDLNQQLFLRLTVNDGTPYPPIPLYSTISALNIPDNIVTSQKIKDGEIKSEDMSDMGGANENQVLTRKGGQWRGEDVPTELPVTATEGQVLVFKAGRWQAENPVVPSGVPIGTIVAFGGQDVPDGWLLCNGYEINVAASPEYKPLFDVIGTAWGGNSSLQTFRIPDLRGRFLRGVDGTANEDPNKGNSDRIAMYPGGNTGNNVGSYQSDAIQQHRHFGFNITPLSNNGSEIANFPRNESMFSSYSCDYEIPGPGRFATVIKTPGVGSLEPTVGPSSFQTQSSRSSTETRPKNVYVNYIIKAK